MSLDVTQALNQCVLCPKLCRSQCPVAGVESDEATNPWGLMTAMNLMRQGVTHWNASVGSLAYKCTHCRACEEFCELSTPVPETLNHFRAQAFQRSLVPSSVKAFVADYKKHNAPYPGDMTAELEALVPETSWFQRRLWTYVPGCAEIHRRPQNLRSFLEILKTFEVTHVGVYHDSLMCCGYPLYAAGDWEGFKELAEVNAHLLRDRGTLISSSPACLYTWRTLYPQAGFPLSNTMMHTSEFLESLLRRRRYQAIRPAAKTVAYHDPCFLGRYAQVYEAPRRVLERVGGQRPREFFRAREDSYCCGGGGLLPVTSPETADAITRERLREFRLTGAEVLVTACATCEDRFARLGEGIEVRGLADYVCEHIVRKKGKP